MFYKLFLDTNIFEGTQFSFNNGLFNSLRHFASQGVLNLQINSVIDREVKSHIRKKLTEALDEVNKKLGSSVFAGFKSNERFNALIPESNEWIEDALSRYEALLNDLGAEMIPVNLINIEELLDDYFNQRLPFEPKKQNEFKDAIAIKSLEAEIKRLSKPQSASAEKAKAHKNLIFRSYFEVPYEKSASPLSEDMDIDREEGRLYRKDDLIYIVVSADQGFCKVLQNLADSRPNEDIKVFEKLSECVDFLSRQERTAQVIGALLDKGIAQLEVEESARISVEEAAIDIEGYDSIDEIEIQSVDVTAAEYYVLSVQSFSDGSMVVRAAVDVSCDIELYCSYVNEDMSPWDREIKAYLWKTIDKDYCEYETRFEMVLDLDFIKVDINTEVEMESEEGETYLIERADTDISIIDSEYPQEIILYEDNCVSRETVDSKSRRDD